MGHGVRVDAKEFFSGQLEPALIDKNRVFKLTKIAEKLGEIGGRLRCQLPGCGVPTRPLPSERRLADPDTHTPQA